MSVRLNATAENQPNFRNEEPLAPFTEDTLISRIAKDNFLMLTLVLGSVFGGAGIAILFIGLSQGVLEGGLLVQAYSYFAASNAVVLSSANEFPTSVCYRETCTVAKIAVYTLQALGLAFAIAGVAVGLIAPTQEALGVALVITSTALTLGSFVVGSLIDLYTEKTVDQSLEDFFKSTTKVQKLFTFGDVKVGLIFNPGGEAISDGFLNIGDPIAIISERELPEEVLAQIVTKIPETHYHSKVSVPSINGRSIFTALGFE